MTTSNPHNTMADDPVASTAAHRKRSRLKSNVEQEVSEQPKERRKKRKLAALGSSTAAHKGNVRLNHLPRMPKWIFMRFPPRLKRIRMKRNETEEPSDPILSESLALPMEVPLPALPMEVPNDKSMDNTGADAHPQSTTIPLEIVGTLEDNNKGIFGEPIAGDSPRQAARGFEHFRVPNEKVEFITGLARETIRNMQLRSRAQIELTRPNSSDGEQSKDWIVRIIGDKKHIETAKEMIKDVMNQTVSQSPLSSGNRQQQGRCPRGLVAPQCGSRGGSQHSLFSGYKYPQRAPLSFPSQNSQSPQRALPSFPSHNSQYPPSSCGNYPPPVAPRSNCSPGWDQRPPTSMHRPFSQGNYNYGQHPGSEYGHHPPSVAQPPQSYTHGYKEAEYDTHAPPQHDWPQPTPHAQGGPTTHSGYGPPQDQYGNPPPKNHMQQPQGPLPHEQPRPNQPVEAPKQGPAQTYGQSMPPPQQQFPYSPCGSVQQIMQQIAQRLLSRTAAPQAHLLGNCNYGQHPGQEYGHHPPSLAQPPLSYTHGYKEAEYDTHVPPQHDGPQPTPHAQGGPTTHSGYGPPQDQYGNPSPKNHMQQPQGPLPREQPRPNQPVEVPKQGPAQTYGQSMPPPQQQFPYAPCGSVQQIMLQTVQRLLSRTAERWP